MQDKQGKDLFRELGLKPPEHLKHLTEDELREALKIHADHHWSQVGDQLICTCQLGRHASKIPTSHILVGTDPAGNPLLEKIQV